VRHPTITRRQKLRARKKSLRMVSGLMTKILFVAAYNNASNRSRTFRVGK
jgi:hypothetical protein